MAKLRYKRFLIDIRNSWRSLRYQKEFEKNENKKLVKAYTLVFMGFPPEERFDILNRVITNITIESKAEVGKLRKELEVYDNAITFKLNG